MNGAVHRLPVAAATHATRRAVFKFQIRKQPNSQTVLLLLLLLRSSLLSSVPFLSSLVPEAGNNNAFVVSLSYFPLLEIRFLSSSEVFLFRWSRALCKILVRFLFPLT